MSSMATRNVRLRTSLDANELSGVGNDVRNQNVQEIREVGSHKERDSGDS